MLAINKSTISGAAVADLQTPILHVAPLHRAAHTRPRVSYPRCTAHCSRLPAAAPGPHDRGSRVPHFRSDTPPVDSTPSVYCYWRSNWSRQMCVSYTDSDDLMYISTDFRNSTNIESAYFRYCRTYIKFTFYFNLSYAKGYYITMPIGLGYYYKRFIQFSIRSRVLMWQLSSMHMRVVCVLHLHTPRC